MIQLGFIFGEYNLLAVSAHSANLGSCSLPEKLREAIRASYDYSLLCFLFHCGVNKLLIPALRAAVPPGVLGSGFSRKSNDSPPPGGAPPTGVIPGSPPAPMPSGLIPALNAIDAIRAFR